MVKRIMFLTLLAAAAGLAQTVNCLVAVVNGEIITLLDVEVAAEFGLGREAGVAADPDLRLEALDALIDRKVVLNLARENAPWRKKQPERRDPNSRRSMPRGCSWPVAWR